jgi:hypothetical protein
MGCVLMIILMRVINLAVPIFYKVRFGGGVFGAGCAGEVGRSGTSAPSPARLATYLPLPLTPQKLVDVLASATADASAGRALPSFKQLLAPW